MTPDELDRVIAVIGLLGALRVTEIAIADGDLKVRVTSRRPDVADRPAPPLTRPNDAPVSTSAPGLSTIRAATHGVFHGAAAPDAEPFVRVGDQVTAGQQVCVIEAMKVFTPVRAPGAGVIERVHPVNGQDVSAGDVLFTMAQPALDDPGA